MTNRHIQKLEKIIGSLEALQNEIINNRIRDRLGVAKSELIRALQECGEK